MAALVPKTSNQAERRPLVVIAGTNASGKSDLALDLAEGAGCEVVSADSRQLYVGLDLGSGKLSASDRARVPHHMIDVREPGLTMSLYEYITEARAAIDSITERGRIPVLVGGTGLYIRAICLGYELADAPPLDWVRQAVGTADQSTMYALVETYAPEWLNQTDMTNPRRVTRAIEHALAGHSPDAMNQANQRYDVRGIWITWPDEQLQSRISERVRRRIESGMVAEVVDLLDSGVSRDWLWSLGLEYRLIVDHLEGGTSTEEFVETLQLAIRQFARKQRAWFRRDTYLDAVLGDQAKSAASAIVETLGGRAADD